MNEQYKEQVRKRCSELILAEGQKPNEVALTVFGEEINNLNREELIAFCYMCNRATEEMKTKLNDMEANQSNV